MQMQGTTGCSKSDFWTGGFSVGTCKHRGLSISQLDRVCFHHHYRLVTLGTFLRYERGRYCSRSSHVEISMFAPILLHDNKTSLSGFCVPRSKMESFDLGSWHSVS